MFLFYLVNDHQSQNEAQDNMTKFIKKESLVALYQTIPDKTNFN